MAAKYQVALVSSEYPPNICGGLGVHVGQMTAALVDQVQYELFVPRFDNYSPTHPSIKLHEVDVPRASNELELWLRFCYATALSINSSPISAQLIHCHDWM